MHFIFLTLIPNFMSLLRTIFGVRHFSSPVRQFASSPVRHERNLALTIGLNIIQLQIAPNPISDRLRGTIQFSGKEFPVLQLEVRDVYGQTHRLIELESKLIQFEVDLYDLVPGLYFLYCPASAQTRAMTKTFTIVK
jgi:hypothetical protein